MSDKPCPVTQIQAYRAYEKLLEIMEDETDDQTEVFSTAYKALYWIANGRRAQPANDPLTLDELRGMDNEPVWIEHITMQKYSHWYIWSNAPVDDTHDGFDGYGKTWLAYRRKPKRSENDG